MPATQRPNPRPAYAVAVDGIIQWLDRQDRRIPTPPQPVRTQAELRGPSTASIGRGA